MTDHIAIKVVVLAIWFASVYAHELGHALAAYWGGDREIRERGGFSPFRIWFNNPLMGLVLPAIVLLFTGFALPGAATRINRASLRSPGVISLVYLAGPAVTLLVAVLLAGLYHVAPAVGVGRAALAFSLFVTIMSFVLNMLPLPSLDGFGAIAAHLPHRLEYWMYRAAIPTVVFLCLLLLAVPDAGAILIRVCYRGTTLLGIDGHDWGYGFDSFRYGLRR